MLLVVSLLGFALALGLFVYLFDNFMGASDTADIAGAMSEMKDQGVVEKPQETKRRRAATGS